MPQRRVRLVAISVDNLFGSQTFSVHLDALRPTVLTGGNGTGKSTLLRLVNGVCNGDVNSLAGAPVDGFILHFDGIADFVYKRLPANKGFRLSWGERSDEVHVSDLLRELPELAREVLEAHNFDFSAAIDNLSDFVHDARGNYAEYQAARSALTEMKSPGSVRLKLPDWVDEVGRLCPVLYITDQRLITDPRSRRTQRGMPIRASLAVEAASADLSDRIRRADSEYARASQSNDRDLPQDIISAMTRPTVESTEDVTRLAEQLRTRQEELRQVGLLDSDRNYRPDFSPHDLEQEPIRRVMSAILHANLQKLDVLVNLQTRLSSFKEFLDTRLAPKQLTLSRQDGMRFKTDGAQLIRPQLMSSGEQQLIVLAFEILFRTRPGTLVIVDEPEISLHILWQDSLISDLIGMGQAADLQFLMATHSPVILAEHPELERPLAVR